MKIFGGVLPLLQVKGFYFSPDKIPQKLQQQYEYYCADQHVSKEDVVLIRVDAVRFGWLWFEGRIVLSMTALVKGK